MLTTVIVSILAGILLVHLFKSVAKAAVLVGLMVGIMWLGRNVTFEALTNDAARALYDSTDCHAHTLRHHALRTGERI